MIETSHWTARQPSSFTFHNSLYWPWSWRKTSGVSPNKRMCTRENWLYPAMWPLFGVMWKFCSIETENPDNKQLKLLTTSKSGAFLRSKWVGSIMHRGHLYKEVLLCANKAGRAIKTFFATMTTWTSSPSNTQTLERVAKRCLLLPFQDSNLIVFVLK